jgi:hypothetical protein
MRGAYSGDGDFRCEVFPCEVLAIHSARTIVSAIMPVLFAYGAGRFSDGPIGTCGSGYCSTRHLYLPHTAADYRAYKAWEMTILIVWPLGLTALFLLQRAKPKGSE